MAAIRYNCDAGLAKAPTFHPSLWGDFFLTYQPPTAPQVTVLYTLKIWSMPG